MEDDFWPSIFCPGVPQNNASELIYYWVLFIPPEYTDDIWECVQELTEQRLLGYRSAKCPDPMTAGEYEGYFTICLHVAQSEKDNVYDTLSKYGLREYVRDWRAKPRFNEEPWEHPNFQASLSAFY